MIERSDSFDTFLEKVKLFIVSGHKSDNAASSIEISTSCPWPLRSAQNRAATMASAAVSEVILSHTKLLTISGFPSTRNAVNPDIACMTAS